VTAGLPRGNWTELGPGDDAAVVRAPDGRVVITTDLLVEGVHFRTDWSSAYDVGRKAAAQSLADVVAMGALPTAIVVGLALPSHTEIAWCDELARGLSEECASGRPEIGVVGGDVVRADRLTMSVTAFGDLQGRRPVTRAGARPGDVVCLLGTVGAAAAGLALLIRGDASLLARHADLVRAHRQPRPPYGSALAAAEAGATAMIDVSDGLAADLGHLAEASGVRCVIEAGDVPLHPGLAAAAADLGLEPLPLGLTGGEDHAFAVVLPQQAYDAARRPAGLAVIGRVEQGSGVGWRGWAPGEDARGYDHFGAGREQ